MFYARLFAAVPELGTNLFNRSNQADHTQQQALASSIAAFASLLVTHQSTDIDAIMARIAAKHASLGVTAGLYEIVREHLFAALAEVLGDGLTTEVATAWHEVYTLMANSLVEQEARLYQHAGLAPGQVWRPAVVTAREYDGAHAATLSLRPADERPFPVYLPGHYISVRVPFVDGTEQIRQYTLTRGLHRGEWALSVKRVPGGLVSPILVDQVEAGHQLTVSHPFGSVVIDSGNAPLLLVSAGIGITNTMAALQHLVAQNSGRQVTIVHVESSAYEHVRRVEFSELVAMLPHAQVHLRYTEFDSIHDDGRNPLTGISLPAHAHTYVCGPVDFMRSIRTRLINAGLPPESVHFEAFAPGSWLGLEHEHEHEPVS
ncbi:globin domain-containing protein [Rhodococcus sp. O3]|uniref:globin domain-containing protein n=1 Tax=Rhodococcus sp. O3 TaxID=3404919 RepID=UPI003B66FEDF